jgi:hypothetical protein
MENLFKLNADYKGWGKGSLVLNVGKGLDNSDGEFEFQDIGYELKNGWGVGYSIFDIPSDVLIPPTDEEKREVERYLNSPWDYKSCTIHVVTSNK